MTTTPVRLPTAPAVPPASPAVFPHQLAEEDNGEVEAVDEVNEGNAYVPEDQLAENTPKRANIPI